MVYAAWCFLPMGGIGGKLAQLGRNVVALVLGKLLPVILINWIAYFVVCWLSDPYACLNALTLFSGLTVTLAYFNYGEALLNIIVCGPITVVALILVLARFDYMPIFMFLYLMALLGMAVSTLFAYLSTQVGMVLSRPGQILLCIVAVFAPSFGAFFSMPYLFPDHHLFMYGMLLSFAASSVNMFVNKRSFSIAVYSADSQ
eukprot:g13236.t1